ncbi:Clp domain protein [Kribbella flavida DSM 17836]|uniref:Clp domain protein n=1 Tax=Kribbella flavida (strain DSM 17836 / JCM 10339 / NBRC 14399) TaxID=479435 RepID=D2PWB1_KRIFD|nr:Clp protease N-terminal domain-containing protein [Kribbella flavida]ADB31563.1 Clp domain protein [Kribbella flavida DSM 17836]
MTPAPNLQQLIDLIRADAGSDDVLAQLATASSTITDLNATSDAALGYFVDRARGAGKSWVEISAVLGVSKQAAHKRFADAWPGKLDLERFTLRTKVVIQAASGIARERGQSFVGTEHLLLGLFTEPQSVATLLMTEAGLTEHDVLAAIDAEVPPSAGGEPGATKELPMTPRASHVIGQAAEQALLLGHNYIGTEHLLLAFYQYPDGVAAKVLIQLGLTEQAARDGVRAALEKLTGTQ